MDRRDGSTTTGAISDHRRTSRTAWVRIRPPHGSAVVRSRHRRCWS